MTLDPTNRRDFLSTVGAAGLLTATACAATHPAAAALGAIPQGAPRAAGKFDDTWTRRMTKSYRAVFDWDDLKDVEPAGRAAFVMDAHVEQFGVTDADLNMVLVIRHGATPAGFNDALWEKYGWGATLKDPTTGEPTKRNPYLNIVKGDKFTELDDTSSLNALRARGVLILVCNAASEGLVHSMSRKSKITIDEAWTELRAGLIPGAILQPSGVYALVRAQNSGCALIT